MTHSFPHPDTVTIKFNPAETPLTDLVAAANEMPGQTFVTIGGMSFTYREVLDRVLEVARGLRHHGVEAGDRVVIIAPNRPETIFAWLGILAAGAVDAPISVEARGSFLRYVVEDLEPKALIATSEIIDKLVEAGATPVPLQIFIDTEESATSNLGPSNQAGKRLEFADLLAVGAREPGPVELPEAEALGTIMYSSGTTGPSKGVMLAHGYYSSLARAHIEASHLVAGMRLYCVQPLCHIDARSAVIDALRLRGEIVLGERFSARRFWSEVEEHDADLFFFVGTMIHLLYKQPARPVPGSARRRIGMGSAVPSSIHARFDQEFNVELIEGYGMTEFGLITSQRPGATEPGNIGHAVPWVEVRIVDGRDQPLAEGVAGELVVRPNAQHLHMLGYWRKPEATLEAWRGLWFHTGDLVRQLPNGSFEYVGRTKDSIRRRGENISAWEVEAAATRHVGVLEAAAIGVPSPLGEEDVALLVVPARSAVLDVRELRDFMAKDLARFAVPRYVEIVDELPKTPSERIAKAAVRGRGLSAAAVDFEAAHLRS